MKDEKKRKKDENEIEMKRQTNSVHLATILRLEEEKTTTDYVVTI